MQQEMTLREMNLRVFKGEPIPHVLFQPRIEPWYDWHRTFNLLPDPYWRLSLRGFFDHLGVSMRYVHYYTGMPDPVDRTFSPKVRVSEISSETERTRIFETPYGDLVEGLKRTVDDTWRVVQFPVRQLDDLKKLRWLYENTAYSFSADDFARGSQFVGEMGEPQFWLPKSPYLALALGWMKFQDLIYALADFPEEVERTMRVMDDAYDPLYEQLIAGGQVRIVNFGENVHQAHMSPRYFERYLLPFYEKRSNQLRRVGIFTHIHIDGYFRVLLRYLKDLPFDGLEALTPEPQGDVTLEEMKEHIGDKVLLDGIPAVMFLPTFSREELMATVERIVDLFHPRLVLGASDEVPEGAPAEAIARVKMVSDWCRLHGR